MDENQLTNLILDWSATFARLTMHDFSQYARSAGLSLTQMYVLMHLFYRGPSEVMDFTSLIQVSPAAASQMIDRMVQQGLVQREAQAHDRRVRLVVLTDSGRQMVEEWAASRLRWAQTLLASLAPEEKEDARRVLSLLAEKSAGLEAVPAHK